MATETKAPAAKAQTLPVLRVVAKRDGFRRAGFEFGSAPKEIPLADLTQEQLKALKAEPMLVCVETEAAVAK